MIFESTS